VTQSERLVACAWCGRRFGSTTGPGRPRKYCRRSCRQRDFESRSRSRELGLTETDLIVTRGALNALDDHLYVLACAIEDVDADLALDSSPGEVRRCLDWLLSAARPLITAAPSQQLRG
jgi:hypothetical protein